MKNLILTCLFIFAVSFSSEAQNMQYENTVVKQPQFRVIDITKDTEHTNGVIYFNNSTDNRTYDQRQKANQPTTYPGKQNSLYINENSINKTNRAEPKLPDVPINVVNENSTRFKQLTF